MPSPSQRTEALGGLALGQSGTTVPRPRSRRHYRVLRVVLACFDCMAAVAALLCAGAVIGDSRFASAPEAMPWGELVLVVCWIVALGWSGQYVLRPGRPAINTAYHLLRATISGTAGAIALTFLLLPAFLAAPWLYVGGSLAAWVLFGVVRWVALRVCPARLVRDRVLLVGTDERALSLVDALMDGHNAAGVELVGALTVSGTPSPPADFRLPVLGGEDEIAEALERFAVNNLVITAAAPLSEDLTRCAVHADARGVRVWSMETAYETFTHRAPLAHGGHAWQASLETVSFGRYAGRFKRIFDVVATLLLLPLALLIMGFCSLLIKIFSPGPVFYHQERVGKDGRLFTFTKLRTMIVDAEKNTGPVWAQKDDPRVTPIGRVLRKMRIDELPQLFSVLKGDMSLIGPRPERPSFVEKFRKEIPLYEKRLMVAPGITGWAQVNHRYDTCTDDVVEKLRYDLYYIRHLCLALDLQIILQTITVILGKKGAH